ncbi:MAG: pseudouridine synthase [Christensenellales bacterium]|jgi:pseudouridine synthase
MSKEDNFRNKNHETDERNDEKIRLQKYLALCGVASRRKSEEYIKAGKVKVNGRVVTEMGALVSDGDKVFFEGKPVRPEIRKRYIMLNKPAGVVTTTSDPEGRPTVLSYVEEITERIYPVGRLDYDTEGLLILTNDGELANRLTHPRYNVEKLYMATVKGSFSQKDIEELNKGVDLPDGHKTRPAKARLIFSGDNRAVVEVTVMEGHNRLVRQMFEALEKPLSSLKREKIGNLGMGGLTTGRWRHLSVNEIKYLRRIAGLEK